MPLSLRQLSSGGQFKAEFFSGSLNHNLSSAAPLTITPPAGKRLRLDNLAGITVTIPDVTVVIGGKTVIDNLNLSHITVDNNVGSFFISTIGGGNLPDSARSSNIQPMISFNADDTITISTTTVGSNNIAYSYSWGEQQ